MSFKERAYRRHWKYDDDEFSITFSHNPVQPPRTHVFERIPHTPILRHRAMSPEWAVFRTPDDPEEPETWPTSEIDPTAMLVTN